MLISICFSSCMNKTVVAEVNFTHGTQLFALNIRNVLSLEDRDTNMN